MARALPKIWFSVAASVALACALSGLVSEPVAAQSRPSRARQALATGIDYIRRGDYELAATFFQQAKAGEEDLAPSEKQELASRIVFVEAALKARTDSGEKLRRAEEALKGSRTQEALNLLRELAANPYLRPEDKQRVQQMMDQIQPRTPAPVPEQPSTPYGASALLRARGMLKNARGLLQKGDLETADSLAREAQSLNVAYAPGEDTPLKVLEDVGRAQRAKMDGKALVANARAALERGELEQAEALARAAEKSESFWTLHLWGDSPSKVLKDIKDVRAKVTPVAAKATPKAPSPEQPVKPAVASAAKAKDAPSVASKSSAPAPAAKSEEAIAQASSQAPAPSAKGPQAVAQASSRDPAPSTKGPEAVTQPSARDAAPLVMGKEGIAQASGKEIAAPPAKGKEAVAQASGKESTAGATPPAHDTEGARQLLKQGRQALQENNLVQAAQCVRQARDKNPELYWWDDTPDKLQADVSRAQKSAAKAATPGADGTKATEIAGAQATDADPRTLLKEARELYVHGKLDEAKELALKVSAGNFRPSLFGDSPESLLADIQKARAARDKEDSVRLLAQARKQLEQGTLDEAEKLAYQAEKLHGPYNIWELGDRPQKLVAEVEAVRIRNRRLKVQPPPVQVAKNDPAGKERITSPNTPTRPATGPAVAHNPPPPSWPTDNATPTPTAAVAGMAPRPSPLAGAQPAASEPDADFTKQHAKELLAECRQLQKTGQLIDARARAAEAQKLNVTYDADEDRPERALLELASLAEKQIENLKEAAKDCAAQAKGEPALFRKAEQDLVKARSLAIAFGLDHQPIDSKLAFVQQLAGPDAAPERGPIAQAQSVQGSAGNRGAGLLDQARTELRRGETSIARRMAEEAFSGPYGVQAEAAALLRSIDTEEFNMRQLNNRRKVDAIVNAHRRKDYAEARLLVEQLDRNELPPEQKVRLKEVLQSPQMQPTQIALTRDPRQPNDIVPVSGNTAGADSFSQQVQAMQEIKFQEMRTEALRAQQQAMERFQAGAPDRAIEILQSIRTRIEDSGLDADRVTLLRRPIDNRVQQFRTLKAQKDFETIAKDQVKTSNSVEVRRVLAEQEKRKQVGELMDKYKTFHKEGKYKEAEMWAMKAHELDPDDAVTGAAVYTSRVMRQQQEANLGKNRRGQWESEGMNNAEDPGPLVSPDEPMHIDKPRHDLAVKRGKFQSLQVTKKTDKDREIERRLNAPINLEFKDTPLKQVIDDLRDMTGVNIITDQPALDEDNITADKPLSMKLEGVSMKSALTLLLHNVGLTYIIKDEVLQVTTEKRARGKLVQKTFAVADLIIPVDNYMISSSAQLQKVIERNGQPNSVVGPSGPYLPRNGLGQGESASTSMGESPAQQNAPLGTNPRAGNRAPGQTDTMQDLLIRLITNTIAPQSWSEVGGPGTIDYFPLGMALIISQTPDVLDQVQGLLDALRRLQDLEVSVEVRMISLSESFYERIGVDFNLNIKTDRITHNFEPQVVTQQFKPANFINDPNPKGIFAGTQPSGTGTPYSPGVSALTTDLDIPIHNSSFQYAIPAFGAFPNIPGSNGGLATGLAFLSDIQVFLFLEAAQGDRRTNVMQAPKLTLFNGQTSTIQVQDFQWFVTNVQVVQSAGQVVFVPQNQPIPLGINLAVQAVVSADRRFVRMNLAPTMTNLASANVPLFPITTFITPVFEGGAQGQPVPFTQFIQQPTFTTITIQTTVSVPDGGTVLLGGLKLMNEGRNEFGPPVLSKVPYINRLFKNTGYGKDTSSLLLMVTPRIIINLEEEFLQTGLDSSGQYTQP